MAIQHHNPIPKQLRQHGLEFMTADPLVSEGKRTAQYACFRTTAAQAWDFPEIELRSDYFVPAITFDLDHPNSHELAAGLLHDRQIPLWNWLAVSLENGHAHMGIALKAPVLTGPNARRTPMQWLARISDYLTHTLGADGGYSQRLTHNPLKYRTAWGRKQGYSLAELGAFVPTSWRKPRRVESAIGRNCSLFESALKWAGEMANAGLDVMPVLQSINSEYDNPLPQSELKTICKSVERYRARWQAQGWHSQTFLDKQRARGRASGKARRNARQERDETILAMLAAGHSIRAVAAHFGIGRTSVHHVSQRASVL